MSSTELHLTWSLPPAPDPWIWPESGHSSALKQKATIRKHLFCGHGAGNLTSLVNRQAALEPAGRRGSRGCAPIVVPDSPKPLSSLGLTLHVTEPTGRGSIAPAFTRSCDGFRGAAVYTAPCSGSEGAGETKANEIKILLLK